MLPYGKEEQRKVYICVFYFHMKLPKLSIEMKDENMSEDENRFHFLILVHSLIITVINTF